MRPWAKVLLTTLLLTTGLALTAGCSSATGADAGVDAGQSFSIIETCEAMTKAKCELLSRCYAAFSRNGPDDCRTVQQGECLAQYERLRPAFEERRVTVNSSQVDSCVARMKGSACPPSFPPGYPSVAQHPFSDCELSTGLLTGAVASGQACSTSEECVPGTTCIKPNGVCLGTCATFASEGEPCAFGCAPGLWCDGKGTSGATDDVCAPLKALNEPCGASAECEPELVCKTTCRPRGKKGEACAFDRDRLSTCEPGLACDVTPYVQNEVGTCVERMPLFGRCRFHWSCEPQLVCLYLQFDDFPSSAPKERGSCQPPGSVDNACPFTPYAQYLGDQCGAGTSCNASTNTCKAAPRLGDACSPTAQDCVGVDVHCKPMTAEQGVCTGPAGLSDRCAASLGAGAVQIPCSVGWCDTQSTQTCRAAYKRLNEECEVDGECLSGRCAVQQDRSLRCAEACG